VLEVVPGDCLGSDFSSNCAENPSDDISYRTSIGLNKCLIIAINESPEAILEQFTIKEGWRLGEVFRGDIMTETEAIAGILPENDAMVFSLICK